MCTEGSRVETPCYQQLFLPHTMVKCAKTVFFFIDMHANTLSIQ